MSEANDHCVGIRQLRHDTAAVLERVRRGETLDVTSRGRLVARLVPAEPHPHPSTIEKLIASGRLRPAKRPGYRPRPLDLGPDAPSLSEELAKMRDEERW